MYEICQFPFFQSYKLAIHLGNEGFYPEINAWFLSTLLPWFNVLSILIILKRTQIVSGSIFFYRSVSSPTDEFLLPEILSFGAVRNPNLVAGTNDHRCCTLDRQGFGRWGHRPIGKHVVRFRSVPVGIVHYFLSVGVLTDRSISVTGDIIFPGCS